MARTDCVLLDVVGIRVLSYARDILPRLLYFRMRALHSQPAHFLWHVSPVHLLSSSLQQLQLQYLRTRVPRGFQQRLRVLRRRQAQITLPTVSRVNNNQSETRTLSRPLV
jgi:hypothetical protein